MNEEINIKIMKNITFAPLLIFFSNIFLIFLFLPGGYRDSTICVIVYIVRDKIPSYFSAVFTFCLENKILARSLNESNSPCD